LRIFNALADSTRMEMLEVIVRGSMGGGEVTCVEFNERFPLTRGTISYHTRVLREAELIDRRQEGRFCFYRSRDEVIDRELPGLRDRLLTGKPANGSAPPRAPSPAPRKPRAGRS
jgi:DNA-binding transcriptional ArsR family regulator